MRNYKVNSFNYALVSVGHRSALCSLQYILRWPKEKDFHGREEILFIRIGIKGELRENGPATSTPTLSK